MADPAAWVWLAILGLVIPFELWAVTTHGRTLSQWLRAHRFVKWLAVVALSAFVLHILFERRAVSDPPVVAIEEAGC
jgi:hypothetical protein